MSLSDAVLKLEQVYTNDDHDRRCPARSGGGGCTCGYDARLDAAISGVFTTYRTVEPPLTKAEVDDMMVKLSRGAQPYIESGNAILASKNDTSETVIPQAKTTT